MKTQGRAARQKSRMKDRRSGTSVFSRLWRYPAGKSMLLNFNAGLTGTVRDLVIPTSHVADAPEDAKLALAAELLPSCWAE